MEWIHQDKDTIAALATPAGEGGIGVIRISGPQARSILERVFVPRRPLQTWRSHQLIYGQCVDASGQMLDQVLAVWMAHGHSYTGEDVAEIHGHGGYLNTTQLLRRILEEGARLAQAGEFTRRAFLHGRMDLTQAEAVASLISAKNDQALLIARQHLQGKLHDVLQQLTEHSIQLAAQVESWIDFPEEFDPALDHAVASLWQDLQTFLSHIEKLCDSYQQGQIFRDGWQILLLGRPNVGKSSLFNRLAGKDKAIVTHIPGTTRDLLETQIALGGIQLTLTDSAGLRTASTSPLDSIHTPDPASQHEAIEQLGVSRTLAAAEQAHLLLAVFDRSRPWSSEDDQVLAACHNTPTLIVLNKTDLPAQLDLQKLATFPAIGTIEISCNNGDGIQPLRTRLQQYTEQQTPSHEMVITNERQYQALCQAKHFLQQALSQGYALGPECMAEDLRAARTALAHITGQISTEDILHALFSRFCIGK